MIKILVSYKIPLSANSETTRTNKREGGEKRRIIATITVSKESEITDSSIRDSTVNF